jgi:hypothetical protein
MKRNQATAKQTEVGAMTFLTLYQDIFGADSSGRTPAEQPAPINLETPDTPIQLDATALSSSSIGLAWSSYGQDTTGFLIERSVDSAIYTQIDQTYYTCTIYTDIGLDAHTQYWYRVRAANITITSGYSNVDSAMTGA